MGGKRGGIPFPGLGLLLLVVLVATSGVALAAAAPKDEWSASSLGGRIVDIDLTSSARAAVATTGAVIFTDAKGSALREAGFATPALRITADGLKVAAARASNVGLVDNAGRVLWEREVGGRVTGLGADRNAQLIAAGADDKSVYLFDGSGNPLGAKVSLEASPSGVAATADRVAVGLPTGKVLLLDRNGKVLWQKDLGAPVNGIDISSTSVAVAVESNRVVAFSMAGEELWRADTGSPARAVAVSDNGSLTLVAAQAGEARLFNAKGEFLYRIKSESESYTAVGLSPGGYFAAVGSREANVKVVQTGAAEAKPEGAAAATPTPAATPAPTPTPRTESELLNRPVATPLRSVIKAPGAVTPAWTKIHEVISGSPGKITSVEISPDGTSLVMLSPRGLYFLDRSGNTANTRTPFSDLTSLTLLRFDFSRDGQRLRASGCEATSGKQVDALYSPSGSLLWSNSTSTSSACAVSGIWASATGSSFVNLSADARRAFWLDGNRQPRLKDNVTVTTPLSPPTVLDLSPDGTLLAVSYGNRTFELFNDSTRLAKNELQFSFTIDDLRFTPDGKLIVRSGPEIFALDTASIHPNGNLGVFWQKRVESVLSWAVAENAFAAGTRNNEVVWVRDGKELLNKKVGGFVDKVALSANGKFLAASSSQAFKAWLFSEDGRTLWEADLPAAGGVAVANDGSVLAFGTVGSNGNLHYFPMTTLDIDSTPSGARVTVDGDDMGTTPVRIQGLTPGNHSVTVSLSGFKDCTGTVDVSGSVQRLCSMVATSAGAASAPATATPTASPTPSPAATSTPTPQATASPAATVAPSPTPAPKRSPGFEALTALAALAALAVAVSPRKRGA